MTTTIDAPAVLARLNELKQAAYRIRRFALRMGEVQGQGYIGQALGWADVLAVALLEPGGGHLALGIGAQQMVWPVENEHWTDEFPMPALVSRCVAADAPPAAGSPDALAARECAQVGVRKASRRRVECGRELARRHGDGRRFLHGGAVSMADLCLVPMMYNARRYHLDLKPYPALQAVDAHLMTLPAFSTTRPEAQPDAE